MPYVDSQLLEQIRQAVERDESIKAFAERAGVDRVKLTNLLNEKDVDITVATLEKIAKADGLRVGFVGG